MENKIIELTKSKESYKCLICCEKPATIKMCINRLVLDDILVTFNVCDECLTKMQKDIETCKQQVSYLFNNNTKLMEE